MYYNRLSKADSKNLVVSLVCYFNHMKALFLILFNRQEKTKLRRFRTQFLILEELTMDIQDSHSKASGSCITYILL